MSPCTTCELLPHTTTKHLSGRTTLILKILHLESPNFLHNAPQTILVSAIPEDITSVATKRIPEAGLKSYKDTHP